MRRRQPLSRRAIGMAVAAALILVTYVSYRAADGLPLQHGYEVQVDVPAAPRLNVHAPVRIAGSRVGQVAAVAAVPAAPGTPAHARVRVRLDDVASLPVDTVVHVRPSSVLGATYLDLVPGSAARSVGDGGTLTPPRTAPAVELTSLLDVFDAGSRTAIRRATAAASGALAGRGTAVNATLASLASALRPATRVLHTVAEPDSDLPGVLRGLAATSRTLRDTGPALAGLVTNAATTLRALATGRPALDDALTQLPHAARDTTTALRAVRPALSDLAHLAVDLRPAGRRLQPALSGLAKTLASGRRTLPEVTPFARRLKVTLATLGTAARSSSANGALRKLAEALGAAAPLIEALAAAQVHCNTLTLWAHNFGGTGYALPGGPGIANVVLFTLGADNEMQQNAAPSSNVGINYLPHANADECESGNEPADGHTQQLGNPAGLQRAAARQIRRTPELTAARARAAAAGLLTPIEDDK